MPSPLRQMELSCTHCDWVSVCGATAATDWLRQAGMLRRNKDASLEEIFELLRAVAPRSRCPACAQIGLTAAPARDDEADWPSAIVCEDCHRPIPPERLEALPGVKRCAGCQSGEESGKPAPDVEYCPRCGAAMTARQTRGGVTRYVMACSRWPACRGK